MKGSAVAHGARPPGAAGRAPRLAVPQPLVRLGAGAGVATVTLARPRMHNALVPELLLDLCVALETAGRRDDVRCVLLLAEGESFSIGSDLRRFEREMRGPGLQAYAAELAGLLNQAMLTLMRLPQPVVAAVHGRVEGAALGLVLAADVVVAAEDTVFSAGYTAAGFSPDGGWTALLPRLAGARRAGAGLMLDRAIPAGEAREWGVVTELAPAGALQAAADEAARRIAQSPPATIRNAKRMLRADLDEVEAALETERLRFIETIASVDAREGVARVLAGLDGYPEDEAAA